MLFNRQAFACTANERSEWIRQCDILTQCVVNNVRPGGACGHWRPVVDVACVPCLCCSVVSPCVAFVNAQRRAITCYQTNVSLLSGFCMSARGNDEGTPHPAPDGCQCRTVARTLAAPAHIAGPTHGWSTRERKPWSESHCASKPMMTGRLHVA